MRTEIISTVLFAILLGVIVYLGYEQVILSRKMLTRLEYSYMTDPGPMELKAAWIVGYEGTVPVFHTVSVIRNAPTETVTAWRTRFERAVHDDLIEYPPHGG